MTLNSSPSTGCARTTYDAFAPFYDTFNGRYRYREWTGVLLAAALDAGLEPGDSPTLLDVACGTGLSAIPMAERGWAVTACDISVEMINMARLKCIPQTRFAEADMRALPRFGAFQLAWAVNDAINYLLSSDELTAAIAGLAQNTEPNGVIVFDVNTAATYSQFFDGELVVESAGGPIVWRGRPTVGCREIHEAEVFDANGGSHVHRQRHFTEIEVVEAFRHAGVDLLAVKGETEGDLVNGLDESVHTKAVYVGRPNR